LGDVSNVAKADAGEGKLEKKPPVLKATQPTGVQKTARSTSSRNVLGAKDKNGPAAVVAKELKRPASVTGDAGNVMKKRSSGSRDAVRDDSPADENIPPQSDDGVKLTVTETVKVTAKTADGHEVEQEISRRERVVKPAVNKAEERRISALIQTMDDEDECDPLMVSEYVYEILDYMKALEETTMPNPSYMADQKALDWRMRGVLIDWLLEVHTRFHLLPETLYLTVNIIDRFLSCKVIQLDRLQLVGVTAMFIASKYEEVLSPHIGNFRHVADDGFTEAEILSAERFVLATLNYDLSYPNPMHFMRRISKADNYDIQTRTLAKYLLEISLLEHKFLEFRPSLCAAASMHLARVILQKGTWVGRSWPSLINVLCLQVVQDALLVHYSGYTEDDIRPTVNAMIEHLLAPTVHQAFYRKYAGKRFLKGTSCLADLLNAS